MNHIELSKELIDFILRSPSMFHSIHTIQDYLDKAGYIWLKEEEPWNLETGKGYYVLRNNSSLIAFHIPEHLDDYHFQMSAAHSDSPTFKIKAVPELEGPGEYIHLDVEAYGGLMDNTWMDRPLSMAGRVLVKTPNGIESRLFYIDKDILLIPNVAIHLNRAFNDGVKLNRQIDLSPLFSAGGLEKGSFNQLVAEVLGVDVRDILGKDLYLVNRERPAIWGWKDEFISSPKLDDLQCAFISLKGFLAAKENKHINVYCCFDNEEVGSNTKQGAESTFLKDTLKRLNFALGKSADEYLQAVAKSFLVSCDNAHAVHPNHPELYDKVNCSYMNKGLVIKETANQKYTTDAFSRAVFKTICEKADVPTQFFANRSDFIGGSTLGNLSNVQVSVHALDIGFPQLAMHSSYETAGTMDTLYGVQALTQYFSTNIKIHGAMGAEFED